MSMGVVNSQFTPQSKIYLLKGLEIDAMNNTFWGAFNNTEEQFNFYIDNYDHVVFDNYTYQRKDGTVVVHGLYDDLRLCNYLIYQNGDTGNKSKWIYCFITSLGYLNDNTTSISFETDVIQTWRFEIEKNFLPSFISYEHRPQWYIDESIDSRRRPCINTQHENIEIGTDLVSANQAIVNPMLSYSFAVIGMTCDFAGNDSYTSGQAGTPSPINYYIFPYSKHNGNDVTTIRNGISGSSYTTLTGLSVVLDHIRKNEKLVGKCVSIMVTDSIPGLKVVDNVLSVVSHNFNGVHEGDVDCLKILSSTLNNMYFNNDDEYPIYDLGRSIEAFIGYNRNSKLYTWPYSYLMLSNNNGVNKIFKNELWEDSYDIKFVMVGNPSSSKINVIPKNYKIYDEHGKSSLLNMDNSFESSYELSIPIINDTTAMLMQSSRNSMNVGLSNIRRSNETATAIASATGNAMSAQTTVQNSLNLSVTSRNSNLASSLNDLQNKSNMINASFSSIGGLSGGIASTLSGNIGGGIRSLVGAGLEIGQTAMQNQINTKQTNLQNANALANANAQASANTQSTAINNQLRELTTKYQNNTNIQNAIDTYNAKIHDAQATADSIVTGTNDLMRILSLDLNTLVIYAYRPTDEYLDRLNKIWDMRGYATNVIDYPNLHSKFLWNYIQTVKCNISGDGIDPNDLEKIKRAFDNGITLWHTKNIGDYSKINGDRYNMTEVDKFGNYKDKKVH